MKTNIIQRVSILIIFLFSYQIIEAQLIVNTVQTVLTQNLTNNSSIKFTNGFNIKANTTSIFRAFIDENNNGVPDQEEYDLYKSKEYVNNILNNKCIINIPVLEQSLIGTFLVDKRCFVFDDAGNNTTSNNCNYTPLVNNPKEYTDVQLEDIKNNIEIAPNPTTGMFTIYIKGLAQGKVSGLNIISMDMSYSNQITLITSQFNYNIDLTLKPTGIYVVQVTLNTGQIFTKSIIKI